LLIRWGCRCMRQQRSIVIIFPGFGVRTHAWAAQEAMCRLRQLR
jgi:hypothetical protein